MYDTVLYFCFREYCGNSLRKACKSINASYKNISHTPVFQPIQYRQPEFRTFVFTNIHSQYITSAIHIYTQCYVNCLFDYSTLAPDMKMYGIQINNCVNLFKGSFLLFLNYRQHLVGNTAYCAVRNINTV